MRFKAFLQKPPTKESKLTNEEHLTKVWKATGKKPDALQGPELPVETAYAWRWFCELFSGEVLTFQEIQAWATLRNIKLLPEEPVMLKNLSVAWVTEMQNDG